MLKISAYEDRVVECRKMAARTRDLTKKAQFEEIARAWQMLAEARMKQLERRLRSRVEYRQRKGLESHPRWWLLHRSPVEFRSRNF